MDVGCTLVLCGLGVTCCYFQRTLAVDLGFSLSARFQFFLVLFLTQSVISNPAIRHVIDAIKAFDHALVARDDDDGGVLFAPLLPQQIRHDFAAFGIRCSQPCFLRANHHIIRFAPRPAFRAQPFHGRTPAQYIHEVKRRPENGTAQQLRLASICK